MRSLPKFARETPKKIKKVLIDKIFGMSIETSVFNLYSYLTFNQCNNTVLILNKETSNMVFL